MISKKAVSWSAALVLATGAGVAAAAAPAWAAPNGCEAAKVSLTSTNGLLKGKATSTCTKSATRALVVEIKWDKNVLPDPLTAKNTDSGTKKSYSASVSSCDKGNKRGYYARGYFTQNDSHHDTKPKDIKSCG
ncbi:hypothetical protein ACIQPT_15445 [Streptomyces sp. NPDC091289]|uniref:hypothetical protein n=1 Tax=Streptomyces sp. NPDC091289 TaxID=3365989 RepID=UPI003816435E